MTNRTQLLYQQNISQLHHTTKILSIIPTSCLPPPDQSLTGSSPEEISHAIITSSTIFHVQGGGQPSDIGTITTQKNTNDSSIFKVKSVRHPALGGQILHLGCFVPDGALKYDVGDGIIQRVDAEKRELHSRLHTAGHILGLAINALSREGVLPPLTESKASHYPDSAAVEFVGTIEGKHKDVIQAKTNEFVQSARRVNIHWWSMDQLLERCTGVANGFALPEGETMGRVVEMEGLGSYPCGGTHVGDCSLVGRVEVRGIKRAKGVSRVGYRVL